MKAFGFFIVILVVLVSYQVKGQNLKGFYSQLTQLNLPYNFSYEMHKHTSETPLPVSLKSQDVILQEFSAVARVDIAANYYFIIVKKNYEEDFDNLFLLLAISVEGNIVDSLPIDIKAEENKGVDFSITADKVIKIADSHDGQAKVSEYRFNNGKFQRGPVYRSVTASELGSF